MTACTPSRWAKAGKPGSEAPRNISEASTRLSSASRVRSQTARGGTSRPIIRSTASATPSSLLNAESQSCRFASTRICR